MTLSTFTDFLAAARTQPDAQRLLFVFGAAELPQNPTPGQAKRFHEGRGGALAPVMCVDKGIDELSDFAALAAEAGRTGQHWDVMFAAALAGRDGRAPAPADVERALKNMIDAIHRGAIDRFPAFDPQGELVSFH